MRLTSVFLVALMVVAQHSFAADFEFGTVAVVGNGEIKATPNRDTTPVIPLTLIEFRTTIEGLDEAVESGKGYAHARRDGMLVAVVTEGEPQIGDTVYLIKKFHGSEEPTVRYEDWYRMGVRDLVVGHDEGFMGASCALAELHESGIGVDKDQQKAYKLYRSASGSKMFEHHCAYRYAMLTHYGYERNGEIRKKPELALEWAKFASGSGKGLHISFYAEVLEDQKKFAEAKKLLQSIIASGKPEEIKRAKKQLASLERHS